MTTFWTKFTQEIRKKEKMNLQYPGKWQFSRKQLFWIVFVLLYEYAVSFRLRKTKEDGRQRRLIIGNITFTTKISFINLREEWTNQMFTAACSTRIAISNFIIKQRDQNISQNSKVILNVLLDETKFTSCSVSVLLLVLLSLQLLPTTSPKQN